MMLEATQHSQSSFVTLTYEDDQDAYSLDPKHLQDWLKRIRKDVEPMRLRFFGVGEYGDVSFRAHYHVALFGFPNCVFGSTRIRRNSCCYWCDSLRKTWGFGIVHSGILTGESAQYIAGYVTKKMTKVDDPRLGDRHPEFSRMSRQPGIGANFASNVAATLEQFNLDQSQDDVPVALRHGKKLLPLGRYLRDQVRVALGKEKGASEKAKAAYAIEMLSVQQAAKDQETGSKEILINKGRTSALSLEYMDKLKKKGTL